MILQYTGTARDAISCCALIGGDQGYDEARRILRERFWGSIHHHHACTALVHKLQQLKEVRTPSTLRILDDELNSAEVAEYVL